MDLHRQKGKPDWELIEASERNFAQNVAAQTDGIITPANIVSVVGAGLTIDGLRRIHGGEYACGVVEMGFGRICDVVDGMVADKTGTKSPLGEALDATLDKVVMAAALPVLVKRGGVPIRVATAFGIQNVANVVATGVAKRNHHEIHPEKENKLATGWQWGVLGSYALAQVLEKPMPKTSRLVRSAAQFGTVVANSYGAVATLKLFSQALGKNKPTEPPVVVEDYDQITNPGFQRRVRHVS